MSDYARLAALVLEKAARPRTTACLLAAACVSTAFFFWSDNQPFFASVKQYGAAGVAGSLAVVFCMAFWTISLIVDGLMSVGESRALVETAKEASDHHNANVDKTLSSLTDWQKRFLTRAVHESRRQFQDFEIGEYQLVWEPEMAMLVNKGVALRHRNAGVYEINAEYFDAVQLLVQDPADSDHV